MIRLPIMLILQKTPFKNTIKKLPRTLQQNILDAVEDILADPAVGELKAGDLEGFRVYKFKANRRVFLLAYTIEGDSVVLFQVGPHENFYRDLKRYLKGMGN
jgi:mRNA-degrading endonuclease RelE of RelBE toxin-antitoxin system